MNIKPIPINTNSKYEFLQHLHFLMLEWPQHCLRNGKSDRFHMLWPKWLMLMTQPLFVEIKWMPHLSGRRCSVFWRHGPISFIEYLVKFWRSASKFWAHLLNHSVEDRKQNQFHFNFISFYKKRCKRCFDLLKQVESIKWDASPYRDRAPRIVEWPWRLGDAMHGDTRYLWRCKKKAQ